MYDAVDVVLSRELGVLSDYVDELYHWGGLSASNSTGVTGRVSVSQGAVDVPSFSGMTLARRRRLRAGRYQRMSLTEGDAFTARVGFKLWCRWGM